MSALRGRYITEVSISRSSLSHLTIAGRLDPHHLLNAQWSRSPPAYGHLVSECPTPSSKEGEKCANQAILSESTTKKESQPAPCYAFGRAVRGERSRS